MRKRAAARLQATPGMRSDTSLTSQSRSRVNDVAALGLDESWFVEEEIVFKPTVDDDDDAGGLTNFTASLEAAAPVFMSTVRALSPNCVRRQMYPSDYQEGAKTEDWPKVKQGPPL